MSNLSDILTNQLRQVIARRERDENLKGISEEIAFSLADLIRAITKGDGGADFQSKSRKNLASALNNYGRLLGGFDA